MIKTINNIITLLESTGETNWKRSLQNILKRYETDNDLNSLKANIRSLYGGMGSFTDLVLQKDGKMYIKENNLLNSLRNKLFEEALP